MPHYSDYKCSECGDKVPDGTHLLAKKVDFKEVGGRVVRSRTVAWLCKAKCAPLDPDYNRPAFKAPGMKSAPLERVRNARGEA